jgi:hypothetical protein
MRYRKAWIALVLLAVLTPLGIIAAGGAWGEWGPEGIAERAGFVPPGMRASAARSHETPLQDYAVPGLGGSFAREGLGTVVAALLGAGATALLSFTLAGVMRRGRGA